MSTPEQSEHRDLRLTLRTLLAWLDDTLPPEEAHSIGQKVAESRFAQDLVERIHKVTRRRRLTVPPGSGPDASDPNQVARYLDNELPSDQITEYEERCLRSDVHLSEAASCHQVLSLIGQKARVPPESRYRMYRLIRGRDAVQGDMPRTSAVELVEPATAPIPEWTEPAGPATDYGQLGRILAGVAGLGLVLGLSAWWLLPRGGGVAEPGVLSSAGPADVRVALGPGPRVVVEPPGEVVEEPAAVSEAAAAGAVEPEPAPEEKAAVAAPVAPVVALATTKVGAGESLVLRLDAERGEWLLAPEGAVLAADQQVVGLPPFRSRLELAGGARVDLIGPAAVRILKAEVGEDVRLALDQGRLVYRTAKAPGRLAVVLGDGAVRFTPPADSVIGLSRRDRREPGAATPLPPALEVFAQRGSVAVELGAASETLTGPGALEVSLPDRIEPPRATAPPPWVITDSISEVDRINGTEFARFFKERPTVNGALLEAVEDENNTLRGLALPSLGAIGSADLVITVLNRPDDPQARRTAAEALRVFAGRSPASARELDDRLSQFGGAAWADTIRMLLAGYDEEAAAKPETYTELVALLDDPDVSVRALALDQLTALTGRDPLGFDPDKPAEGNGKRAWQDLLREGALKPATRRPDPAVPKAP